MAALIRRIINTATAPAAIGPYSQAVVVDRTVYVSGQLGMDPSSGQLVQGGVQAQTRQALVNMGEILKAAGCSYENVVKTTVLLADMNDFTNVNDVYKQFQVVPLGVSRLLTTSIIHVDPLDWLEEVMVVIEDQQLYSYLTWKGSLGGQIFRTNYPARAAYQVAALPRGGLVEIEAVAILGPLSNASNKL